MFLRLRAWRVGLKGCWQWMLPLLLALMGEIAHAQELGPKPTVALPRLHVTHAGWLRDDGTPVSLKGVNLGNWLMLEFWMMGQSTKTMDDQCTLEATLDQRFGYVERQRLMALFRDNWMAPRDWDLIPTFGLNMVRLPFIWSLIEDEKRPLHLRTDAWHYLDQAIDQAEARGLYVILDLHGAVGSQGMEHHSGCAGKNLYWTTPAYQARTTWLWQQIANRYKNRAAVAGYSLLNEPWGVPPAQMAPVMKKLYASVRAVDPHHPIIFPGHYSGIDDYGKPGEPGNEGLHNVAFEMHFYPGHFGWGKPGVDVHRQWLQCIPAGTGLCEWTQRMARLDSTLFVGEFQPWADMDEELGGRLTRLSFDAYASKGWASALWSYKMLSATGGQVPGNWGLVTNRAGDRLPTLDFTTASLQDIEGLFRLFGTVSYESHKGVIQWMNAATAPPPIAMPAEYDPSGTAP